MSAEFGARNAVFHSALRVLHSALESRRRRGLGLPGARLFAFRFLGQADGLHLVGIRAVLRDDLRLGALDFVVIRPFGGSERANKLYKIGLVGVY